MDTDDREFTPTLAEIRAACLEIQREWTEHERRRRAAWAIPRPWSVPGTQRETAFAGERDR
jgi:hypothetical protein